MKKKIIIFMPSIEGGGVEKNLFLISNYLCTRIEQTYLITASKSCKSRFNKKIKLIYPKSKFWDNQTRRLKYFVCIYLLIKKIFLDKNFIIFAFQANLYCILIAKLFRTKIIIRSNSSPEGWSKNIVKNFIFRFFLKKADTIIVNSLEFKKQLYEKFNVNAECIYNPLNVSEIIKLSKKQIKNNITKNKYIIKIINIGRYVDQKDQITLLKAINVIKDKLKLELIMMGRGIFKNKFKNYIFENNLKNIVKLVNFQKNPYPFIKNSNIFILSSKYEGLPNVLLEAITLNKFVISSDCPTGPGEILSNGKGGLLFKTGDYKELANKILYYAKNKKICEKKLQYSRKQLYRFSFNKNLIKYFNVINKYINQ